MTPLLLPLTLLLTAIPFIIYLIYILAAITAKPTKPTKPKPLQQLPNISIVIPAYNEETVLEDRINNLAEVYPKDKMEIIISNDGSSDNTEEIATKILQEHSLTGKVITHHRSGVNKAINRGINETSSEIVVITGADGLFDKDTIPDLVSTLLSSDDIGAVSGDLIPVAKGDTVFSRSESAYRSIYGRICTWESNVHSTYCFNGHVVAFKKTASSTLNTRRGADDASMALSVIRKGYSANTYQQRNSTDTCLISYMNSGARKIRRATRLLEATFFN